MTVRRGLSLGAGLLLVALAVVLAFLAADVRAWPGSIRANDLQARIAPARSRRWEGEERVPFALASRLLGIRDDIAFRRTIRLYTLSGGRRGRFGFGFFARSTLAAAAATRRLVREERAGDDLERRSAAANFLGALRFSRGGLLDPTFARQAVNEFQTAVRFNPWNDEAKFNLELTMQRSTPGAEQNTGGGTAGRSRLDELGAGSSGVGRGY